MLDFAGREVGTLIRKYEDLVDFVYRNLGHVVREAPQSGISFSQIESEYVLDVTPRPAVYPYYVVAHYDDERKVIRLVYVKLSSWFKLSLKVTEPTAYKAHCDELYNTQTMEPWLTRLKESAQRGETEVTFEDVDDNANDSYYNLNNKQADWLRSQGFLVEWDKYPREWTVKGLL